jgi:FtsP/CotA-like multicopper oxidase with cupredoxin domain
MMRHATTTFWMLLLTAGMVSPALAATPFANPPEIVSGGGVLAGTLTAAPATIQVGAKEVTTTVYNGLLMPPLLRVQPGDQVQLQLQNSASFSSNIHYHGFQVTPQGAGDNVFLDVMPGQTFPYDFQIPADHPAGLFWYHPHFHPDVNPQIAGGLSGGIIVGDILAPFPELTGITERVLLLKDTKIRKGEVVQDPDPSGPTTRTVNGLFKPTIDIQPGELQFWRIGNIGANIYYKLKLPGHTFYVLAQDGNLKNQLVATDELLIPPAARYEVLIRGGKAGKYALQAQAFNTGPDGDRYPAQKLATLVSGGDPVAVPRPLPTVFPSPPDLRQASIDTARTIDFADATESDDPSEQFTINDKFYDHNRIDTTVTLGNTERWTLLNSSKELHVFHIHQTDFQVISVNGVPQAFTGYQDTVSLPFATKEKGQLVPGEVTVIIPFTNPVMVGEFVYHCHIVQHADQGMMANIEVVAPGP